MDKIVNILVDQYLWDIGVMSDPWMYYPLLIPITLYLPFFFAKWAALTLPFWLPFAFVAQELRKKR